MRIKLRTHIIFWVIVTVLLTAVFGKIFESLTLSFYFVAMLLPVAVDTSCFFNLFLVPHYLLKKRYGKFSLYFIYLLIFSTYLEMWVITGSFIFLANLDYDNLNPVAANIFVLIIVLYFIVILNGFLLLISRSFAIQNRTRSLKAERNRFEKGYITVRVDRQQAKILYEDINYIESMSDYVKIFTDSSDAIITRERISHIDKKLPQNFLRIHRSFIINSQKINYFSKTEIQINDKTLPVSRTYKKKVSRKLSKS